MSRINAVLCVLCARCSCSYTSSNSHACVSQLWLACLQWAPQDASSGRRGFTDGGLRDFAGTSRSLDGRPQGRPRTGGGILEDGGPWVPDAARNS